MSFSQKIAANLPPRLAQLVRTTRVGGAADMPDWRDRILNVGLILGLGIGAITYLPSVAMASRAGLTWLVVADTLALLLGLALFLFRNLNFRLRASAYLALFYGIGCVLLVSVGALTDLYFLCFVVLSAILLGTRAALAAAVLSTTTYAGGGYYFDAGVVLGPYWENSIEKWAVLGANLFLVDLIVVGCLSVLVRGLDDARQRAQEARAHAATDHMRLLSMHLALQQEVSARKEAELRREHLAMAAEQAAEVVLVFNAAGELEYANPAYTRVTGFPVGGDDAFDLKTLDGAARERGESIFVVLDQGLTWRGRIRIRNSAGDAVEVESSLRPVADEAGQIQHFVGIIRDISEEVELERRLRQAQKLEAVGTLAGGIAHDFNNILLSMMTQSDLLREELQVCAPAPVRARVAEIVRGCGRAKDLVQQILTFSRQMDVHREPVSVHQMIDEILPLLRASVPTTISIETAFECPKAVVFADPTQVHQVILNLCMNAAHAMEERGGVLRLSTQSVPGCTAAAAAPELDEELEFVRLSVRDTGTGIPAHLLERIFDPFFTTKPRGKGTGLGLATVHGIVTKLGGGVRVDSTEGEGSVFEVYLPQTDRVAPQAPQQVEEPAHGAGERITLIDDEQAILDVSRQLLERLGYQVRAFSDSEAAWNDISSQPEAVDLIITDQTMPRLTGLQLAAKVRAVRPDLPVLLTSGYSDHLHEGVLEAEGLAGFLQKPYTRKELSQAIYNALTGAGKPSA